MRILIVIFIFLTVASLNSAQYSNLTDYTLKKFESYAENDQNIGSCENEDSVTSGLLGLINFIAANYLKGCVNVILYDKKFEEQTVEMKFNLRTLLKDFPGDHVNGQKLRCTPRNGHPFTVSLPFLTHNDIVPLFPFYTFIYGTNDAKKELSYAPSEIEDIVGNNHYTIYWKYSFPTTRALGANEPDIEVIDRENKISENKTINVEFLIPQKNKCTHFLLFIPDLTWTIKLVGQQTISRVVVVTLSTRWKIEEYLEKEDARKIVNLLVISHIWKQDIFFGLEEHSNRAQYTNLYTHNLLTDPIGSSTVRFLTAWRCGKLTRNINLFPPKISNGFNGKQFTVSASEQPPFTFKKRLSLEEDSNESSLWDGVEIRILRLLADFLNYTIQIKEPKMIISNSKGPSEIVIEDVKSGLAEIGSAGVYVTNHRLTEIWLSMQHSTDCAAFITKASTSLPRYRAILGPFQLSVWVTLTLTYLIAIIPLTFADSHSLKPLIKNPWLIENMFWHVFGTFTNLFTFSEKNSWSKTKKNASRLLIGWYWAFSIIITACYTGSIVSFITLFVFPDVIDHVDQLVKQNFRIGTLSTAGWGTWFNNSEHEKTKWLLRDVELVPNTTQGLKNVSNSFYIPMFRPYAFLAGRAQMEYIVQANYTNAKRGEMLHITKDCFVPFGVSFVFPRKAIYTDKFNEYILRMQQSGLMGKLLNEFKWEVERSSTGKLLQAGSGKPLREVVPLQRKLTLDDMQGMYLLMGAGYLIALVALLGELIHNRFKNKEKHKTNTCCCFGQSEGCRMRIKMFYSNIMEKIRGQEFRDDYFDYDHDAYKKYDSRILKSRNAPKNNQSYKATPYVSETRINQLFGEEMSHENCSNPSEGLQDIIINNNNNERGFYKDESVFESVTSLPWQWGSNLHFRKNCDQDRVHTS